MVIDTWNKNITIAFNGEKLEVVAYYKYLFLECDGSYNWNSYVEKLVVWGIKVLHSMQNKSKYGVQNWGSGSPKH